MYVFIQDILTVTVWNQTRELKSIKFKSLLTSQVFLSLRNYSSLYFVKYFKVLQLMIRLNTFVLFPWQDKSWGDDWSSNDVFVETVDAWLELTEDREVKMDYNLVRGDEKLFQRLEKLQYGLFISNAILLLIALANFSVCIWIRWVN